MVDAHPEDTLPPPDSGRAKRAPPTIDLEATEVSAEPAKASTEPEPARPAGTRSSAIIAALSGAVAAGLVIAAASVMGWPATPPPAAPQVNTAELDGLAARIAKVESKANTPAAVVPDPAAAARIETLEKSLASLRGELATARGQSDKLAAAINEIKSAPRETQAAPDLSDINARLAEIERNLRARTDEITQEGTRTDKATEEKPADDVPLRRVVAAALLDISVRQGDPFGPALAAAKALAANADALKPLDGFATSGVPSAAVLSRELLTLVPKLTPPLPENATTGTGLVDRLQAGAAKLVKIQRTDTVGTDRGAVVARVTAAALRNDSNEARRELNTLAPADRAAAQAWLDKADARDAALAASRQFAADAMAALAKPAP
jgi:hypothetical protein